MAVPRPISSPCRWDGAAPSTLRDQMATKSPQHADGHADRIRKDCAAYRDRAERVHPGCHEQDEADPYRHPSQPGREILLSRGGFDGAGADVPVHTERNPTDENEDSGWHRGHAIAAASRTAISKSGVAGRPSRRVTSTVRAARPCKGEKD